MPYLAEVRQCNARVDVFRTGKEFSAEMLARATNDIGAGVDNGSIDIATIMADSLPRETNVPQASRRIPDMVYPANPPRAIFKVRPRGMSPRPGTFDSASS